MGEFKPALPYNVPVHLLVPTYSKVKGVTKKAYPEPSKGNIIYCSVRTFGGTESLNNGVLTVIDTATVETWYRPDIKADCRLVLADDTTKVYEVIGTPENINMRNQFIKFRVEAVGGGA